MGGEGRKKIRKASTCSVILFVFLFFLLCVSMDSWIRNESLVEGHSLDNRHDITPFITNPLGAICAKIQWCGVFVCMHASCKLAAFAVYFVVLSLKTHMFKFSSSYGNNRFK